MLYPRFEEFSDPSRFDQGIAGFLDHILRSNFAAFVEQTAAQTGREVAEFERVGDGGEHTPVDSAVLGQCDTLIVISFDSLRTNRGPEQPRSMRSAPFSKTRIISFSFVRITTSATARTRPRSILRRCNWKNFFITEIEPSRPNSALAALPDRCSED